MHKIITLLIVLLSINLGAQSIPSQLRVLTDANNYLLVSAAVQTNPISQPTVFTNTRLKTDSSGSLQVILTGTITPTYPLAIPASTCSAPSLGLSGAATTGIAFTTTPSILECIVGNIAGTWSIPTGNSNTSNYLNITGTLPAVLTSLTRAVVIDIAGNGNSSQLSQILYVNYGAGYTGSTANNAGLFNNNSAGTNVGFLTGNIGNNAQSLGVTIGHNTGNKGVASGSSSWNVGLAGQTTSNSNSPTLNTGIVGVALNATTNIGGFFGLMSTAPTLSTTSALIADNGAAAADIFEARDNGTVVAKIQDGGNLDAITFSAAGSAGITASGSACAITNIKGGIIITASCTP